MSYTLYLVHFPLLALLFFTFGHGVRIQPSIGGYVVYLTLLGICITFCAGFWWCFERNTERLRGAFSRSVLKDGVPLLSGLRDG